MYGRRFALLFYRLAGMNQYYSKHEYCSVLRNNYFFHYDLRRGIPMPNKSAKSRVLVTFP